MSLRVVFFGNSESVFANRHFAALAAAPCQIEAVVDVPPAKRISTNRPFAGEEGSFTTYAAARGIPAYEPANPNARAFVDAMAACRPDVLIAVGYLNRLGAELLGLPRLGPANFHASLLPAYRGKHPLFWALRHGARRVGLTVHRIDAGLDTGDILYQVAVRTRRRESVEMLYDRVMEQSVPLVGRLLNDLETSSLVGRPQGAQGASYYGAFSAEDFRLDWRRPAAELERWICATPGRCFSDAGGRRWFAQDAAAVACDEAPPGRLVTVARATCTVATGRGGLRLHAVRPEGAATLAAAAWFRSLGLRPGDGLID